MAAPPPAPGPMPPQAPPPLYPGYPPPYGPPPIPPPKKDNTVLIIVVVLVAVLIVVPAILAVWFLLVAVPLIPNLPGKPTVTFGAVSPVQGNRSFSVASISQPTISGYLEVNLRIEGVLGSSEPLRTSGSSVVVGGTTYIVYWEDLGNSLYLSTGDGFRVAGDRVPLPAGTYVFYLVWVFDGSEIASATWTI